MKYLNAWGSRRFAVGLITFLCALHSEAALVDCAHIPDAELPPSADCAISENPQLLPLVIPSAETRTAPEVIPHSGFQINSQAAGVPSSILLMGFFASLIGVLLVRAKGVNSK